MPSNYIIGEEVEKETIILEKIENARKEIENICNEILNRKNVYRVKEGKLAILK